MLNRCRKCWICGMKKLLLVRRHAVWTGAGVVCLDEEFWSRLVPVFVPTDSWLLTSTMKEQIAPLSIISPPFMISLFFHICSLCSLPLFLSFSLSLSLSHTHMHKYTPQGRCRESMLHCSTALRFSMHPAVHGIWPQAWQLLHSSVYVCCPSRWTVGQHKNISSDRCLSFPLTCTHAHMHACTHTAVQYAQWLLLYAC